MNLPRSYARCYGEFQDHWMTGTKPCAKRDECLRYVQMQWDALRMVEGPPEIPHCADEGSLSAFIPLDAFEEDEQ